MAVACRFLFQASSIGVCAEKSRSDRARALPSFAGKGRSKKRRQAVPEGKLFLMAKWVGQAERERDGEGNEEVGHERESPLLVLTYDFQTLKRGSRAEIPHYQAFSQGFYWLALQFLLMFRCFFGSLLSAPNGATWLEGSNRKCRAVHLG